MKKNILLASLGVVGLVATVGCGSTKAAEKPADAAPAAAAAPADGSAPAAAKPAEGSCGGDKKAEGSCGASKPKN